MNKPRRARLLLPVGKIFLMHSVFRFGARGGPGFAPGLRPTLGWARRSLWHGLIDLDRIKYRLLRFRQR